MLLYFLNKVTYYTNKCKVLSICSYFINILNTPLLKRKLSILFNVSIVMIAILILLWYNMVPIKGETMVNTIKYKVGFIMLGNGENKLICLW